MMSQLVGLPFRCIFTEADLHAIVCTMEEGRIRNWPWTKSNSYTGPCLVRRSNIWTDCGLCEWLQFGPVQGCRLTGWTTGRMA